jgi:hypothetical protein
VLRKLIPKLQAFSQCIQETPMVRFYSSIDANDKMLISQMSGDGAFHGIPHQIAVERLKEDRMPRQRSRRFKSKLIRVRNSLLSAQRRDF